MNDTISRLNEVLQDRYLIENEIGEGGMATVYLAEDLRHHRKVALKVLKPELAAVVGAERFLVEIETTARLSHPHILPVYDSGEADGSLFFVTPFVEGGSLRERLERERHLSIEESLEITRSVASALAYAHERGVVHRDIKPANILLSKRGEPTVADFGVALAVTQAGGTRLTETGLVPGTAAYMSPEQASGLREIDARSDIYSLACVLYEMLAGSPPFEGPTAQAVTARKLSQSAPDVTTVRDTVSAAVAEVVHKALARLPADRYETADRFAEALGRAAEAGPRGLPDRPTGRAARRRRLRAATGAALVILAVLAAWGWLRPRPSGSTEPVRMAVTLPPDVRVTRNVAAGSSVAVSPDGRSLVIVGTDQDGRRLYRRTLDQLEVTPLPGTEGAGSPFFSPDGTWLGFFADGHVWRIPAEGGTRVHLASAPDVPMGASWSSDDRIVFSSGYRGPLRVVSADGGDARPLTTVDTAGGELSHRHPEFLPDGRTLLFVSFGGGLHIESLDLASGTRTRLTRGVAPRYVPTGHLLLSRETTLFGAALDRSRPAVAGPLVPLIEGVTNELGIAAVHYDVSATGTLAYVPGSGEAGVVLRTADGTEQVLPARGGRRSRPRFSPDGNRLALRSDGDIWIHDLRDGTTSRLTFEGGEAPVWTPDGSAVTFGRRPDGLFMKPVGGRGEAERILNVDLWAQPVGWTPDGEMLAIALELLAEGTACLAVVAQGRYRCLVETDDWWSRLSPDGRWLAYQTDETGRDEIYVTSFPEADTRWQISRNGGSGPAWGPEGEEIFYRSASRLVAARIDTASGFDVASRRVVLGPFHVRRPDAYDIHPDGRTLAFVGPLAASPERNVVAVLGWFSELRRQTEP